MDGIIKDVENKIIFDGYCGKCKTYWKTFYGDHVCDPKKIEELNKIELCLRKCQYEKCDNYDNKYCQCLIDDCIRRDNLEDFYKPKSLPNIAYNSQF